MSSFVQSKLLPSGYSIPAVALGVFHSQPGPEAYNAVLTALKLGYRHIDTATAYQNESDVGKAIRDSGIPRSRGATRESSMVYARATASSDSSTSTSTCCTLRATAPPAQKRGGP
ncbi:hypothetical protein PRNP1_010334 [Phytophthora ramorum]